MGRPVVAPVLCDRREHHAGLVPRLWARLWGRRLGAALGLGLLLAGHSEGHLVTTEVEAAYLPILLGLQHPRVPVEPGLQPGVPWHQFHRCLSPAGPEKAAPQGPAPRGCFDRSRRARDRAGPCWPSVLQHAAQHQHPLPPLGLPYLLIHRGPLDLHRLCLQVCRRGRSGVPLVLGFDGLVVEELRQRLRGCCGDQVGGRRWRDALEENISPQHGLGPC
mmetsp:Transcript_43596/g.98071  ORF Transcript_43596/g.98071 Transcript_43596/m.98071 type:complete len:219 (-) Transcript_43596:367-1023(-)